jgi:hypothetical protein
MAVSWERIVRGMVCYFSLVGNPVETEGEAPSGRDHFSSSRAVLLKAVVSPGQLYESAPAFEKAGARGFPLFQYIIML